MGPRKRTILVAEDEEPICNLVSRLLENSGYSVIVSIDGAEALCKSRAHEGPIDLLLSDIQMPGMTGIELATELHRERPATKVLLMSGLASGMLVLDEGWQFMPKPLAPEMLKANIRSMLGEAKLEDVA